MFSGANVNCRFFVAEQNEIQRTNQGSYYERASGREARVCVCVGGGEGGMTNRNHKHNSQIEPCLTIMTDRTEGYSRATLACSSNLEYLVVSYITTQHVAVIIEQRKAQCTFYCYAVTATCHLVSEPPLKLMPAAFWSADLHLWLIRFIALNGLMKASTSG